MKTIQNVKVREDGYTLYRMVRVIDGRAFSIVHMVSDTDRNYQHRAALALRLRSCRDQMRRMIAISTAAHLSDLT